MQGLRKGSDALDLTKLAAEVNIIDSSKDDVPLGLNWSGADSSDDESIASDLGLPEEAIETALKNQLLRGLQASASASMGNSTVTMLSALTVKFSPIAAGGAGALLATSGADSPRPSTNIEKMLASGHLPSTCAVSHCLAAAAKKQATKKRSRLESENEANRREVRHHNEYYGSRVWGARKDLCLGLNSGRHKNPCDRQEKVIARRFSI